MLIKKKTNSPIIEIKNFGPINSGKIEIKPLTIIIGPNNSGKSYSAMLLHSIFETCFQFGDLGFFIQESRIMRRVMYSRFVEYTYRFRDLLNPIFDKINKLKEGEELLIDKVLISKISHNILKDVFEGNFKNEIRRYFASKIRELIKKDKSSFQIKLFNDNYVTTICSNLDSIKIKSFPKFDYAIKVQAVKSFTNLDQVKIDDEKKTIFIKTITSRKISQENLFNPDIWTHIIQKWYEIILGRFCALSYYLPAARSGILQAHKALAAGIIEKASLAGIKPIEVPKLSGVVTDFISSILNMSAEKEKLFKLASRFENELINGEIVLKNLSKISYPDILYVNENVKIPLHRASSTVSEMAPLFLYLKYRVNPNSFLIIEEPEAHLHPRNQRILAKYLVRLIRKNVKLIITTHSELLLEQFNTFMKMSKIKPETRVEKYGYEEDDYLNYDEVSPYVFQYDTKSKGYNIKKLKVTGDEGIDEEEFSRVYEVLNEESIKLNREFINKNYISGT